MTETRIEELKTLTALASSADTFFLMLPSDTTEVDLRWIEAARNGLERLLGERERLLAALKYVYASEDEKWKNPSLDPKAAIAYAESA